MKFKKLSFIVFWFFIFCGLVFSFIDHSFMQNNIFTSSHQGFLLLAGLFYVGSHLLRITRLYIIFIEKKFSFVQLLKVYTVTAWVSLVIPFKLGEIFRISEFSKMCRSFKMGFVSIWVERFFDSLLLVIIFISIIIYTDTVPYVLLLILVLFILFTLFIFLSFPISYTYTKQLALSQSQSNKGLHLLEFLESLKHYYSFAKKLVRGRFAVLFCITTIIWLVECVVLFLVVRSIFIEYDLGHLVEVLNNIWLMNGFQGTSGSLYKFVGYCVLSLGSILALVHYLYNQLENMRKDAKKSNYDYRVDYQFKK